MSQRITRRELLKRTSLGAAAVALAACQPKVVRETVIVEKPVEKIVKETVVVKEAVEVEKEVTREVEKVVEIDKGAAQAAQIKGEISWNFSYAIDTGWPEERVQSFEAKFPNTKVKYIVTPRADQYPKRYAAFAAGTLADVAVFDPGHYELGRAAENGVIIPLDDFVDAEGFDSSPYYPGFWEIQSYKDRVWGLPSWGWSGWDVLAANKLDFAGEGIPLPAKDDHSMSMDTIGEWARRFYEAGEKAGEVERFGMWFSPDDISVTVITRAFNSGVLSDDGTKSLIATDEKTIAAYRWMYDLAVTDKAAATPAELSGKTLSGAFVAGKMSMQQGGSLTLYRGLKTAIEETPEDQVHCEVGHVWFPQRDDGRFPTQIRGGGHNVVSLTKHPEVAWEFVKHLSSQEGITTLNLIGKMASYVRSDVMPVLISQIPEVALWEDNLANGMKAHIPANWRGNEYKEALLQSGTRLLNKTNPIPFEQGLQELHDSVQAVLDMPMG